MPTVDWDHTTHNVLTIEWIEGIALYDRVRLPRRRRPRSAQGLARKVIQSFLRHAVRDGFFHADMHPGNLFADPRPALSPSISASWAVSGRRSGAFSPKSSKASSPAITAASPRAILRPVMSRGTIRSTILPKRSARSASRSRTDRRRHLDGKAVGQLFEVNRLFDMQTRPELMLLQKSMVVVEGVARTLDPKLDIWTVSDPVVREWIERNLGPIGRIQGAMSGAGELGRVMASLPAIASRAVAVLGKSGADDARGRYAVAGDDRGDGPDREPQEPLAHPGALDHRGDLHRNSDCRAYNFDCIDITFLISMLSFLAGARRWPA